MLQSRRFNQELPASRPDDRPFLILLTNSGIERELYERKPGHRIIQNSLDCDRLGLIKVLLRSASATLVIGDPRADKERWIRHVSYQSDEGHSGPWVFDYNGRFFRAQQAEVWLFRFYLDQARRSGSAMPGLVLVSARTEPPYHRVLTPPELSKALSDPLKVSKIELPCKWRTFDPPHPKWPGSISWAPSSIVRATYRLGITLYGLGQSDVYASGSNSPRNSIRDLWAIENCADMVIALHNGRSLSTKWNYEAARSRGVPSILVSFDNAADPKTRRVEYT